MCSNRYREGAARTAVGSVAMAKQELSGAHHETLYVTILRRTGKLKMNRIATQIPLNLNAQYIGVEWHAANRQIILDLRHEPRKEARKISYYARTQATISIARFLRDIGYSLSVTRHFPVKLVDEKVLLVQLGPDCLAKGSVAA